jgi:uncharacterized membrane protein YdjX (TVP38/TMEM64 family)
MFLPSQRLPQISRPNSARALQTSSHCGMAGKAKALGVCALAVGPAVLVWLNHDALWAFINVLRDREAVVAFLDQLGFVGPVVLTALLGLQVLIPSLPAEPLMIAGAYAYGFPGGLLMNWLVAVVASQAVFYLARYAGRPVVEHFVPAQLLDKWTRIANEKGAVFFLMAFLIPAIPSDIMTYVAGMSGIDGRRFLVASVAGQTPTVVLLTLVGADGLRITPVTIVALTIFGVLSLLAWWYFMVRRRPEATASRPSPWDTGRPEYSNDTSPTAPRGLPSLIRRLARMGEHPIQPLPGAETGTPPALACPTGPC